MRWYILAITPRSSPLPTHVLLRLLLHIARAPLANSQGWHVGGGCRSGVLLAKAFHWPTTGHLHENVFRQTDAKAVLRFWDKVWVGAG